MYALSEEGQLLQDLSPDPLIPGTIVLGSYVTVREGIFGFSWRKNGRGEPEWQLEVFDGIKWALI